jgi:ribosomal protein S18 acetylase RimI-like enzyme
VEEKETIWKSSIERNRPSLLVAKEAGCMLGWIACGSCRDVGSSNQQAEIWAVYVSPESWGRGVGSQLWLTASEELCAAGFTSCSLWVLAENSMAKKFYRSHGFKAADEPPKHFQLGGILVKEERWHCDSIARQKGE